MQYILKLMEKRNELKIIYSGISNKWKREINYDKI